MLKTEELMGEHRGFPAITKGFGGKIHRFSADARDIG